MSVPSEDEIRAFAKSIGALGADGRYLEPRNKLAAGAVAYREELAIAADLEDEEPPTDLTTAEQLAALHAELHTLGFTSTNDILAAVAGALVRRDGLHTKGIPNS